jgi:hypothetical protein
MSTFQDCSAAAQYAALGRAETRPATPPVSQKTMSGLAALGRRVGAYDTAPRAAEPVVHSPMREAALA